MVSEASLGPMNEDRVANCRQDFSSKTEDALIFIKNRNEVHTPEHVAAEQLLSERRKGREDAMHLEAIAETRAANKLSKVAIGIAVLSLSVAALALGLQLHEANSSKPTTQTTTSPAKESPLSPQSSPLKSDPAHQSISSQKSPPSQKSQGVTKP